MLQWKANETLAPKTCAQRNRFIMAEKNKIVEPFGNGGLQRVESEIRDEQASLHTYEVLTYPADYTLQVLFDKFQKGQVTIPRFQRGYVWTQIQASKLIESFVLGLPVPAIFLYQDPQENKLLVVDGQQRLRTITYFFEGYFGEEHRGHRPVFRLTGLEEGSPLLGKTYDELRETNEAVFNKLNDAVLRAFVIKQLNPVDDTSIYHVFERLNTGGTLLHPQEIRNCIYHGPFNDLLVELNTYEPWRKIFGRRQPEKRQRDVELILRFFALFEKVKDYEKPMKEFLNKFMRTHRDPGKVLLTRYEDLFHRTVDRILQYLGEKPFHIRAGLNAAVFDSVITSFASHSNAIPHNVSKRYETLKKDAEYLGWVSSGTTDKEVVQRRLDRAQRTLFD